MSELPPSKTEDQNSNTNQNDTIPAWVRKRTPLGTMPKHNTTQDEEGKLIILGAPEKILSPIQYDEGLLKNLGGMSMAGIKIIREENALLGVPVSEEGIPIPGAPRLDLQISAINNPGFGEFPSAHPVKPNIVPRKNGKVSFSRWES